MKYLKKLGLIIIYVYLATVLELKHVVMATKHKDLLSSIDKHLQKMEEIDNHVSEHGWDYYYSDP